MPIASQFTNIINNTELSNATTPCGRLLRKAIVTVLNIKLSLIKLLILFDVCNYLSRKALDQQ